jgi:hypothetical protein
MQTDFYLGRIANSLIEFNFHRLEVVNARRRARRAAARTVAGWVVRNAQRLLPRGVGQPGFRTP